MPENRLRVTKSSRRRLRALKGPGKRTYSEVLDQILPMETDEPLQPREKTSISVTPEIRERVFALADDDVPAHRVVEYYLIRHEMENVYAADELLGRIYKGDGRES